jgi:hypothetical protein
MAMATAERDRPRIVVGDSEENSRFRLLGTFTEQNAARALWAGGLIYLIGSLADLAAVWILNRVPGSPDYEFTALANTLDGTPRIVLAVAMIWVALHIRGSNSLMAQRLLSSVLLVLGIAGAIMGAIIVADYFVLRTAVAEPDQKLFLSITLKALTLSALHLVVLVPVGVLGVRRPRG